MYYSVHFLVREDKLLTKVQTDSKTGNFIFTIPNKKGLFAFEPYIKIVHSCSAKPVSQTDFLFGLLLIIRLGLQTII